jgi:hypothetical protein
MSGPPATQVGLGGEGVLRTYGPSLEAKAVIEQAAVQDIFQAIPSRSFMARTSACTCRNCIAYPG